MYIFIPLLMNWCMLTAELVKIRIQGKKLFKICTREFWSPIFPREDPILSAKLSFLERSACQ